MVGAIDQIEPDGTSRRAVKVAIQKAITALAGDGWDVTAYLTASLAEANREEWTDLSDESELCFTLIVEAKGKEYLLMLGKAKE